MLIKEYLNRKNFTADEFFASNTVYRLNKDADPNNDIINYPSKEEEQIILPCLMSTANMMQKMYDVLFAEFQAQKKQGKFFIKINSAYRCLKLNKLLGSKDTSQHVQGLAVDLTSSFGSAEDIMKYLFSIKFPADQCFCEGTWLHYSCQMNHSKNRMMYGYYLPDENGVRKFKAL